VYLMQKYIPLLLILCTYTHADTSATIIDYEKKAYFHEVAKEYGVALGYHEIVCDLNNAYGCYMFGVV